MKVRLTIILFVLIPFARVGAQSTRTHFTAEYVDTRKSVSLPREVLTILSADKMVDSALAYERIAQKDLPQSWFLALPVRLSSHKKGRNDLIVMGEGPLHGSNVTTFWIFSTTIHGPKLVLTLPAHDVFVKNSSSKGFYDVEATSLTATNISTVLFRYDGEKYVQHTAKSKSID